MRFTGTASRGTPYLFDGETLEPLSPDIFVVVNTEYTFSTDTILLAAFSKPKNGETCADLGTGCGAIPLIWNARANPAFVYAVELQKAACDMADRSVEYNGLSDKISVVNCDIKNLKENRAIPHGLDLIACNPPYTESSAGMLNPAESRRVARHETACRFSEIASAGSLLRWGGRFCCCMKPARLCDTLFSLRNAGIEPKRLRFVQQRKDKPPFIFLLQANRGGKPGINVEPALIVETETGGYSSEMLDIYGTYKGEKYER